MVKWFHHEGQPMLSVFGAAAEVESFCMYKQHQVAAGLTRIDFSGFSFTNLDLNKEIKALSDDLDDIQNNMCC